MKDGTHQVPPDQYEKNLRLLVEKLKATGAKLIWASTTPLPEGIERLQTKDAIAYNAIAKKIMMTVQSEILCYVEFTQSSGFPEGLGRVRGGCGD